MNTNYSRIASMLGMLVIASSSHAEERAYGQQFVEATDRSTLEFASTEVTPEPRTIAPALEVAPLPVVDSAVEPTAFAGKCSGDCRSDGECRCKYCCKAVCCPQRTTSEVEKYCWNVKSKLICIPDFRWPWERCRCGKTGCDECGGKKSCGPLCGKVRCVNLLEKHEYTCKKCGYKWEVKCVRSGCKCSRHKDRCPNCGCATAPPVGESVAEQPPRGAIEAALADEVKAEPLGG